jgi:hypothetical protein
MRQGSSQEVCETTRLQDETVNLGVKRMRFVRCIGNPIPVLAGVDEVEPPEPLKFLLHGPQARSRTTLDFARVQHSAGCTEQEAKDLSASARREKFS